MPTNAVENARRQDILRQYHTRMAEVLADPTERAAWAAETANSEVSASEVSADCTHLPQPDCRS